MLECYSVVTFFSNLFNVKFSDVYNITAIIQTRTDIHRWIIGTSELRSEMQVQTRTIK